MAKLPRVSQKIFCGSAPSQSVVFGSTKTGVPVTSLDPAVLQGNAAFLTGYLDSVEGDYAPYLEETNALHTIATTQLAYLYQEGIPEYDAATTYYAKSLVKKSGTEEIYASLTDGNVGNALTDGANWALRFSCDAVANTSVTNVSQAAIAARGIAKNDLSNVPTNTLPLNKLANGTAGSTLVYGATGIASSVAPATSGYVWTSNGNGAIPSWQAIPVSGAKASANIDGIAGTLRAGSNISSVVKNSTGDYTLYFATALPDANFSATFGVKPKDSNRWPFARIAAQSTTFLRVNTMQTSSDGVAPAGYIEDVDTLCVTIF